jgi:hypothetical protein
VTEVTPGGSPAGAHGGVHGEHDSLMDAADWDQRYRAEGALWGDEVTFAARPVLAALDAEHGNARTAVDLACGSGRHALWLARHGWQVAAVDFSREAVDQGRRISGRSVTCWTGSHLSPWTWSSSPFSISSPRPCERSWSVRWIDLPRPGRCCTSGMPGTTSSTAPVDHSDLRYCRRLSTSLPWRTGRRCGTFGTSGVGCPTIGTPSTSCCGPRRGPSRRRMPEPPGAAGLRGH